MFSAFNRIFGFWNPPSSFQPPANDGTNLVSNKTELTPLSESIDRLKEMEKQANQCEQSFRKFFSEIKKMKIEMSPITPRRTDTRQDEKKQSVFQSPKLALEKIKQRAEETLINPHTNLQSLFNELRFSIKPNHQKHNELCRLGMEIAEHLQRVINDILLEIGAIKTGEHVIEGFTEKYVSKEEAEVLADRVLFDHIQTVLNDMVNEMLDKVLQDLRKSITLLNERVNINNEPTNRHPVFFSIKKVEIEDTKTLTRRNSCRF